jgi:hypothetical protein
LQKAAVAIIALPQCLQNFVSGIVSVIVTSFSLCGISCGLGIVPWVKYLFFIRCTTVQLLASSQLFNVSRVFFI